MQRFLLPNGCIEGSVLCEGWVEHKLDKAVPTAKEVSPAADAVELHSSDAAPPPSTEGATLPSSRLAVLPAVEAFVATAANYDGQWYIGKVNQVDESVQDALLSYMTNYENRGRLQLKWPDKTDELWVSVNDILIEVDAPKAVGRSQRFYELSANDLQKVIHMGTDT